MNNATGNSELLKAFLDPLIKEMVERTVEDVLSERLSAIKLKSEPERPILIDEAAEMLGYSRSHLYTLCRNKKIPFVKKGRWLYFYVSELNQWLRSKL
jgi:excisionase family DNA binding protein